MKTIDYRAELEKFAAWAVSKNMNLAGDDLRFFNLKTARAWTAWVATESAS